MDNRDFNAQMESARRRLKVNLLELDAFARARGKRVERAKDTKSSNRVTRKLAPILDDVQESLRFLQYRSIGMFKVYVAEKTVESRKRITRLIRTLKRK